MREVFIHTTHKHTDTDAHRVEVADEIPLFLMWVLFPESVMACILNQRTLKEIMRLQSQIKAAKQHIRTKANGTHLCVCRLSDIWQ